MNTRSFCRSLAVLILILLAVNVGLHLAAAKTQRGKLLRRLDALPLDTQCLFIGNSLMEAGLDGTAFVAGWEKEPALQKPVNVALGGTSPVEHYLILRRAYSRPIHPRLIVYGFMDDQLNSAVQGNWADLLGNRAFSYYFPAEAARFYFPGSWLNKVRLQLIADIPMLSERSTLWAYVDRFRRQLGELGLAHKDMNRFGRVEDFAALEARDLDSFDRRCQSALKSRTALSAPIQRLLQLAQEHGASVVFVEMPMPVQHQTRFYSSLAWVQFEKRMKASLASQHADYISAAGWVPGDDSFQDPIHLNARGAKIFSARLARELSQSAAVPSEIHPPESRKIALSGAAPDLHQLSDSRP